MAQRIVMWAAAMFGLGWYFPPMLGAPFFDTHLMVAYCAFSVIFLTPWICDWVAAGRRPLSTQIANAASIGLGSSLMLIVLRIFAANQELRAPYFVYPDPRIIASLVLIATSFALFGSGVGAWLTLRGESAESARARMRTGVLGLLMAVVLGARLGPESFRAGMTGLLAIDAIQTTAVVTGVVFSCAGLLAARAASNHPRYGPLSVFPPTPGRESTP